MDLNKVYVWSSSSSESDSSNIYLDLPDGVSNVQQVNFHFNEVPYSSGRSSNYHCENVDKGDERLVQIGGSFTLTHSRNNWTFGVASEDGRPYTYHYFKNSSCTNHWDITLTFYYKFKV